MEPIFKQQSRKLLGWPAVHEPNELRHPFYKGFDWTAFETLRRWPQHGFLGVHRVRVVASCWVFGLRLQVHIMTQTAGLELFSSSPP